MTSDSLMNSVMDFPWPLKHYERWLSQRSTADADDYLYSQSRVRLVVHDDDQLVIPHSVSVERSQQGTVVRAAEQGPHVALAGVKLEHADAIITALHSRPTAIELPFISGVPAAVCEQLLSAGFGRFIFAPRALEQLESGAHAAEIVRFPGSPYELVRNYWNNMGSLNREISRSLDTSRSATSFVSWLRALHVRLLLGCDMRTFYCPSSPIAQRRAEPGALYQTPSRTLKTSSGEYLLDGPRVNASALGGARYHDLIARSLGLPRLAEASKEVVSSEVAWGRLVLARSRTDTQLGEWFLPPRPMADVHWEAISRAWIHTLEAIESHDVTEGIRHLGMFHWYFVRLHPFTCANQSLAFSLVNFALNCLVQSGIPHLILDQLALRYDCESYGRLFARAVGNWMADAAEPAVRHMARVRKRQVLEEFIARVAATTIESDAQAFVERNAESAGLALLLDGTTA